MSENNHEQLEAELASLLEKVFQAYTKEYHKRGFKLRVGRPRGLIGSSPRTTARSWIFWAALWRARSGWRFSLRPEVDGAHRTMIVTADCASA